MMRCPACDNPNHGISPCLGTNNDRPFSAGSVVPFDPRSNVWAFQSRQPQRQDAQAAPLKPGRRNISSGEDAFY